MSVSVKRRLLSKRARCCHLLSQEQQVVLVRLRTGHNRLNSNMHGKLKLASSLLSQEQQVVLVRLRTGHNRLNSNMHGKLKLASSPTCPCGQEDQTTEHVLQRFPFTKLQEKMCDLSALPWWQNSTAASRSWRKWRHSSPKRPWSCRLRTPRRRRS